MWLKIVLLFSVLNQILAFIGGKNTSNGDDYSFVYAIWRLTSGHNVTELKSERKWQYTCVATAISQSHLITAAHCLSDYWGISPKESLNIYYIQRGYVDINLKYIEDAVPIDAKDVRFHQKFDNGTCSAQDVVIITLPKSHLEGEKLPLCLHLHEDLKAVSLINAQINHSSPLRMNYCTFKIRAGDICIGDRALGFIRNSDTQICTTSTSFCTAERGDSGSPLITTTKSPCLLAILSCGNREWTIFSNVVTHRDWIRSVVHLEDPYTTHNGRASTMLPSLVNVLITLFSLILLLMHFNRTVI